jgi:LmbE family N-acetylglucosaminyl deacetylase
MPERTPTILLVHAHPDDEASTTGGTIARYAAGGARVVLVTCTNGELGDSPEGHAPDHEAHDRAAVAAHRLAELEQSVRILGIARSVLLDFHDSGMADWEHVPGSFFLTPLEETAQRLATVLEEERPDVVITYDENGFYGHPDHIKANQTTRAALELVGQTPKLYYATIPRSAFGRVSEVLERHGVVLPGAEESGSPDEAPSFGASDDQISAEIDVSRFTLAKRAALEAHASQTSSTFFLQIPTEAFDELFVTEYFERVDAPVEAVESDLLAGTPYEGRFLG